MVILTLTEKGGEPKQLTFEKNEVTIGRVQGNDVILPKGNVSKRHCRIVAQDGQFSIEDLKSTNGTYVNGRKIADATVVSGTDKIYVGDFVVRIENAAGAEAPTGPEAGSLGAAVKRPPPPPPARPGSLSGLDEADKAAASRTTGYHPIPPPLPPPKRDSSKFDTNFGDEPPPAAATAGTDIDLDEDPFASSPRLNVPPLKPVFPVAAEGADDEEKSTRDEGLAAAAKRAAPSGTLAPLSPDFPGWLRTLFESKNARAVYISGPQSAEVEVGGKREPAELTVGESELMQTLRDLAAKATPRPAGDASMVNATLPDGAHLALVFPPAATQICAAIIRPGAPVQNLAGLSRQGVLSKDIEQLLEACISARRNVLVSGDRQATATLLQALAHGIETGRVVVTTDQVSTPAESKAWVRLASGGPGTEWFFAAAALRPEHLVVEITSAAVAGDLVSGCALGLEGVLAAIGARSTQDALRRLIALAGSVLGAEARVRDLIAGGIDVLLHATTLPDGNVRVLEVAEPRLDGNKELQAEPLVFFAPEGGAEARGAGSFQVTGTPARLAATLAARGTAVPSQVLRR